MTRVLDWKNVKHPSSPPSSPTLPVCEWNECELPFPIGIAGIEKFINNPFNEKAFRNVAFYNE